jgi:hypothetical protein
MKKIIWCLVLFFFFTINAHAQAFLSRCYAEGRLISRVQLFEDLLLKVQKIRRKGGKK